MDSYEDDPPIEYERLFGGLTPTYKWVDVVELFAPALLFEDVILDAEELMKPTCHNDDIVKFRNDFKSLWESFDPQLKSSIGKVALRDFIYKQLKNSKKLEKQMKDYEQVNKYDTPRK